MLEKPNHTETLRDADENDDDETDCADFKEEVDDIKVDIRAPFDTKLQKFSKSDRNTVVQQQPLATTPTSLGSSNSHLVKAKTEPEEWTTAPFFFQWPGDISNKSQHCMLRYVTSNDSQERTVNGSKD